MAKSYNGLILFGDRLTLVMTLIMVLQIAFSGTKREDSENHLRVTTPNLRSPGQINICKLIYMNHDLDRHLLFIIIIIIIVIHRQVDIPQLGT